MSRLIDIDDERFWDVLFDEACVEGKQAERIKNELEKIVVFDTEKVVEQLEKYRMNFESRGILPLVNMDYAVEVVRNGGKE